MRLSLISWFQFAKRREKTVPTICHCSANNFNMSWIKETHKSTKNCSVILEKSITDKIELVVVGVGARFSTKFMRNRDGFKKIVRCDFPSLKFQKENGFVLSTDKTQRSIIMEQLQRRLRTKVLRFQVFVRTAQTDRFKYRQMVLFPELLSFSQSMGVSLISIVAIKYYGNQQETQIWSIQNATRRSPSQNF